MLTGVMDKVLNADERTLVFEVEGKDKVPKVCDLISSAGQERASTWLGEAG